MISGNMIDISNMLESETYFVAVPFACHLHDVRVVSQDTGMSGETVVFTNGIGGTDIGTATFSTDVAGEVATYVAADADQEIAKDGIIQIVTSDFDNATDKVHITIELDPYRLES